MHLMWGLLEGRKKLGVRGEKKSFNLPTVQGGLSSSSAHLSPSFPFPPSILHATANVWMLGWLGKTLSEIYSCWTVLYSFFFSPADGSVNSRLLCEAVNLEITYLIQTLLLKNQTKKGDSWDQGDQQPNLAHDLRVSETSELGEKTV